MAAEFAHDAAGRATGVAGDTIETSRAVAGWTVRTGQPAGDAQATCCAECGPTTRVDLAHPSLVFQRGSRRALVLAWVSLLWMTGEGALGLLAGVQSRSVALVGWALGSAIEGLASVIVIWRFTGSRAHSDTAEARAQKAVAVSFFLLAPYIAVEAVRSLVAGDTASPAILGIAVTGASLLLMPVLGFAKRRLGAQLASGSTAQEGVQNFMCAAQAGAVLVGLAVTVAFGWSWLDPLVALVLAGWAIREGRTAWRGDDCC